MNAFLIEHRDGLVLFDTGIDPAITSDPNYFSNTIGRFLSRRIFRFHVTPEDALRNRLREKGFDALDIKKAIISHLHFDHIGGIVDVPNAELLVSAREWAQLSEPQPEKEWVLREHIELPGAQWHQIEFEPTDDPILRPFGGCHDVMGDGSMMLIPTPGHTPGSMSLLVRTPDQPPVLFVGDLTYDVDLLMSDTIPGTGDPELMRTTFAKVRALKEELPDLIILATHDPKTEAKLKTFESNEHH